ncbi:MAG: ATP-binding protein, partial [Nitratireductor sp.]
DISRLDAGAMKPAVSAFRLDGLMRQIGTDFLPLAREKGLDLRIVPSSLTVATDRNLMRRLLQNLVSNAIKYTRSGTVLVGARRRGGLVEIQVLDSGIGIPADQLNTVFREFHRLDAGAREAQGLGLGLSIVDRIARVLRLEIRIGSHHGRGTVFSVILPVASAVAAPVSTLQTGEPRTGYSLAGLRVLCIDNETRILDGMRLLLEGWGCDVTTATGLAAYRGSGSAERGAPDVILADYHLDNDDGIAVVKALRKLHKETIPAILLTADRSADVRDQATEVDVPVLNKPIKPAQLRSLLARWQRISPAAE